MGICCDELDENVFILHCCNSFQCKSENLHTFSLVFILDVFLKQNADKKAFENFEKNVKSANVQANPKEGVVSERFESKYVVWRVKCISVLKKMYCIVHVHFNAQFIVLMLVIAMHYAVSFTGKICFV